MDIKPIETVYKGYRFRSRLEARWAVFFDAVDAGLGTRILYEPEGFQLADGTMYLPDFYDKDTGIWIEVKGVMSDLDLHKLKLFRGEDYSKTLLVLGNIPTEEEAADLLGTAYNYAPEDWGCDGAFGIGWDYPYLPCICPVCGKFGFTFDGRGWRVCAHDGNDGKHYSYDHPRIIEAFRKARQARFEHGETPIIRR